MQVKGPEEQHAEEKTHWPLLLAWPGCVLRFMVSLKHQMCSSKKMPLRISVPGKYLPKEIAFMYSRKESLILSNLP